MQCSGRYKNSNGNFFLYSFKKHLGASHECTKYCAKHPVINAKIFRSPILAEFIFQWEDRLQIKI